MIKKKRIHITKSKYLCGLQCIKYLWIRIHEPERIPDADDAAEYRFTEGYLIDTLAKQQYPEGIDIPTDDFMQNIRNTKAYLMHRKPLFEAGFMADNLSARADILLPAENNAWDIIEVKSSTEVKDYNVDDVAFQKYCYEKAGITIRSCFLMHVDSSYVRDGGLDAGKLLKADDITNPVSEKISAISETLSWMNEELKKDCPGIDIGDYCTAPFECPLFDECWKHIPKNNVFNLYRGGKKSFALYQEGILAIKNIPIETKPTSRQSIQKECAVNNSIHIEKENIRSFLQTLQYPLNYLDFESFSTAIPQFDKSSAYQQIPFQFSLHIMNAPDDTPVHHSFLAEGRNDPRKDFLNSLQKNITRTGSIIVYNQSFEKAVLKKLVSLFPESEEWIDQAITRFIDLLIPFREFHYYNQVQKGSASLKSVLPAITGKNYDHLSISDGMTASRQFVYMTYNDVYNIPISESEKQEIRNNLEEYCGQDTEAMIWIVEALGKIAY